MTALGLTLLIAFSIANAKAVMHRSPRWWINITERGIRFGFALTVVGLLVTVWRWFA